MKHFVLIVSLFLIALGGATPSQAGPPATWDNILRGDCRDRCGRYCTCNYGADRCSIEPYRHCRGRGCEHRTHYHNDRVAGPPRPKRPERPGRRGGRHNRAPFRHR